MDCIAAMPEVGDTLPNALMMKVENAKKIPATSPEPSAEMKVKTKIGPFMPALPVSFSPTSPSKLKPALRSNRPKKTSQSKTRFH